jgi:hypothetical protein
MPRVGFKPTISASKRAKTVHVLDHSATVTGPVSLSPPLISHDLTCDRAKINYQKIAYHRPTQTIDRTTLCRNCTLLAEIPPFRTQNEKLCRLIVMFPKIVG